MTDGEAVAFFRDMDSTLGRDPERPDAMQAMLAVCSTHGLQIVG
jgi:hypothetical protein